MSRDTVPDEPRTGHANDGVVRRVEDVERRVDRLYREHFGEGDYDGTREQVRELRVAFDAHAKEYHEDKSSERAERQEERDARNRAMDTLAAAVAKAVEKIENRKPSVAYLILAIVATASIVWMALPK